MAEGGCRQIALGFIPILPPALLVVLKLSPDTEVALAADNGRFVVEPLPRPRYALAELLARSDYAHPRSPEDREWIDAAAIGRQSL